MILPPRTLPTHTVEKHIAMAYLFTVICDVQFQQARPVVYSHFLLTMLFLGGIMCDRIILVGKIICNRVPIPPSFPS